ncbi:Protein of unknown function [Gryllus bimaculatus]|nr:Protein of unknown function [Gryllus bimaculatus]
MIETTSGEWRQASRRGLRWRLVAIIVLTLTGMAYLMFGSVCLIIAEANVVHNMESGNVQPEPMRGKGQEDFVWPNESKAIIGIHDFELKLAKLWFPPLPPSNPSRMALLENIVAPKSKFNFQRMQFDSRSPIVLPVRVSSLKLPTVEKSYSKIKSVMDDLWECHMSVRGILFLQDPFGKYVGIFRGDQRYMELYIINKNYVLHLAAKVINVLSSDLEGHVFMIFRPARSRAKNFVFRDGSEVKSLEQEILETLQDKLRFRFVQVPTYQLTDAKLGRLYSLVTEPERYPEIDTIEQLACSSLSVVSFNKAGLKLFELGTALEELSGAQLQARQRILEQSIRIITTEEFEMMVTKSHNVAVLLDTSSWITSSREVLFGRIVHILKEHILEKGECLITTK